MSSCASKPQPPVPLRPEWWDHWLDPASDGDQTLVDTAIQAALPITANLEVSEVDPIGYKPDGAQLMTHASTI